MAEIKFSQLTTAAQLTNDDIFALAQAQGGSLSSVKTSMIAVANFLNTQVQYTTAYNTQAKTTAGAINELKQLISLIPQFSIEVVEELPTEDISDTTIYLVPAEDPEVGNYYEEYIHVNDAWELVGTTAVDLSAYYTKLEVDGLLATKASVAEVELKENKTDMPTDVRTIIKDCKTPKSATITNGIAQFECIEENLVKGLKVTMNPIQDLHGYPNPWAGGAGKNKVNAEIKGQTTSSGITGECFADNRFVLSGTSTGSGDFVTNCTAFTIPSGTTYTISIQGNVTLSGSMYIYYGNAYIDFTSAIKSRTRTASEDITVNSIRFRCFSGVSVSADFKLQIEFNSTATDYAPYSNICPISGRTEASVTRTGVNQWDGVWESGDINVGIDGTNHANANRIRSKNYVRVKPNTTYYFKTQSYLNFTVVFYGQDKSYPYNAPNVGYKGVSNNTLTIPEWCYYIRIYFNATSATYNNDVSVNYPSTDTEYHAYTAETKTHQYSETIYGGVDDFVNGVATVNTGFIEFDGSNDESWTYQYECFNIIISDSLKIQTPLCDKYVALSSRNLTTLSNGECAFSNTGQNYFNIKTDVASDVASFRTWLSSNHIVLVYKLDTPTTIETSAEEITTVSGTNIISGTEPISECQYTELATVDDLIKIIGGQ